MVGTKGLGALTMGGAMIIASVFIFVLGISTDATADNGKCFMAVKKFGAALEKVMKQNKRFRKELKAVANLTKKSAKKHIAMDDEIETYMKDKDITKAEAKKISKMTTKLGDIEMAIRLLKEASGELQPHVAKAIKYWKKVDGKCK